MEMNYFKWVDSEGKTFLGMGEIEEGSENELSVINYLLDQGYTIVKITQKEYKDYDGGCEVVLSKT
jgi:hypothetical protein